MLSSRLNALVMPTSHSEPDRPREDVVSDDLDVQAARQHDHGGGDLCGELREGAQVPQVVGEAGDEDDRDAGEDSAELSRPLRPRRSPAQARCRRRTRRRCRRRRRTAWAPRASDRPRGSGDKRRDRRRARRRRNASTVARQRDRRTAALIERANGSREEGGWGRRGLPGVRLTDRSKGSDSIATVKAAPTGAGRLGAGPDTCTRCPFTPTSSATASPSEPVPPRPQAKYRAPSSARLVSSEPARPDPRCTCSSSRCSGERRGRLRRLWLFLLSGLPAWVFFATRRRPRRGACSRTRTSSARCVSRASSCRSRSSARTS